MYTHTAVRVGRPQRTRAACARAAEQNGMIQSGRFKPYY